MPLGLKLNSLKSFGNKITSGAKKFGSKIASGVNDAVDKVQDVAKDAVNQVAKGEKVFNNALNKVADVSAIATPILSAGLSMMPQTAPLAVALTAGNKALQMGQDAYSRGRKEAQVLGQQVVGNAKALVNQSLQDVKNAVIRIGDEVVSNAQQQALTNGLQRQ